MNENNIVPSTTTRNFSWLRFFMGIIILIFVLIGVYLTVLYIWWYFDKCKHKKSFWNFVADLNYEPCKNQQPNPLLDLTKREILREKEVFNISNQKYTYEQAQKKCAAYGARLATENEVTQAYNDGANWCNYGWTQGSKAFFPVQPCWWRKQPDNIKKQCGKPGLNGGYFDNKMLKFGVNCFGIKPEGEVIKPKSAKCKEKDIPFCKRPENKHACSINNNDNISPWNQRRWSEF